MILYALYFILPALVLLLKDRIPVIDKVGAVTVCYALGIAMANMPGVLIPAHEVEEFAGAMVAIAIPILLFNTDLRIWIAKGGAMLKSFICCIVAVAIAAMIGTLLFQGQLDEAWKLGSMMMGVYTGGTANMAAIGRSVGVDTNAFVLLQGADVVIGGAWLLFLLSASKGVFGRLLKTPAVSVEHSGPVLDERFDWKGSSIALFMGVAILALGALLSSPLQSDSADSTTEAATATPEQLVVLFLFVTTSGLLLSLYRPVRTLKGTYGMGNFLLLVFCVAVGSLANIERIVAEGYTVIIFVGLIIAISISIHLLLARLLKIDRDTMIISSTAALYGPPFVPPVAKAIGNPQIVSLGIAISLLGLALGNYCGIGISYLLRLL